jgi:chromosome segregation ATPase
MSPRSKSPSRRESKKKHKQSGGSNADWENDEMSHNILNGSRASDFDYFKEIAPKIAEVEKAQEVIQSESKKVNAGLKNIMECLKDHGDAVSVVGESLEREQEREKKIEELETTIRQNRRLYEEDLADRGKKWEELEEAAGAGQRKEKALQERESKLGLEFNKKIENLRITEETRRGEWESRCRKEMEQELQRRVGEYSGKAERLEQQTKTSENDQKRLREENERLLKSLEEKQMALEGLKARYDALITKLKESRDEFGEGENPERF